MYKDTALSVAVQLRGRAGVASGEARVALAATLYAALLRCNATVLRDHAYLAEPRNMAYLTLKHNNASEDQMTLIRQYLDKLNGMGEVDRLIRMGLSVNSLLFNADQDYRTEVIYRLARTGGSEQARISCALAEKYDLDVVNVWLQYAAVSLPTVELHTIPAAAYLEETWKCIRDALWPSIRGNDYPSLISFFTILKKIDDKIQMYGLNVSEHLMLLKKTKAASTDLDYKIIVERAPSEHFNAHVLSVMRADNAGMVCKLLRTLPPAVAPPADAHCLYIKWLTGYFFNVAATGASKKWMQRWRQCVGFFTKLSKDEIMEFVAAVCFSREALERVPSGTRNLIILQAMDYCQQEQENDFKFAKNEPTWGQMGQELGRWGRFLENYHSSSVQAILDASDVPKDVWFELEMSHGALEGVTRALARAVLGGVCAAALASLLQCLRVPAEAHYVLQRAADDAMTIEDIEVLVTRITQYHKDGVKSSEEYLEKVMQKATELGLPPHKQLGLLSLSQCARVQNGEDLVKVAQYTVDLFKTEWSESAYANELTEGKIVDPEGRREALRTLAPLADTWQRRKALADALACWPPTYGEDGRSLHCEYLQHVLAQDGQRADNLVLLKMLVRRPILTEQEVKLLAETAKNDIVNTIWVILLNPCESSHEILRNLLNKYKELVQKLRIEDEMIKEILDQGMFIKLVTTSIYSNIVYYILHSKGQEDITYTAHWAIAELIKANYLAEAGHLQLLALGTTTSLIGFSESVLYCLDMMK